MEKNKLFERIKIRNDEIYTEQLMEVKPLSCAVNPATGREQYYEIKPTNNSKNLMVIGGGLTGMEATRIAKILGYNVTLYEKGDELGGYVITGSKPDFNFNDRRLLNWYKNEMKILEVNLVMNTKVTELMINDKMPDVVIVATGDGEIILKEIPGIDKEKVAIACEVVLAIGFKSEQDLCYKMNGKTADLYIIGDANNATNIRNPI